MNRATYLIAALSILLLAGILLVITLSLEKSQPDVVAMTNANVAPPASPPVAAIPRAGSGLAGASVAPSTAATQRLPLEPRAHDPAMIKEGD